MELNKIEYWQVFLGEVPEWNKTKQKIMLERASIVNDIFRENDIQTHVGKEQWGYNKEEKAKEK